MKQSTDDTPELMVKVQSRDAAGGEVWTASVGPRLLALLDRVAKHRGLVGNENEDPLRSRLCALGQLLAAHGTIKAVYPLM
jgi:hypothetical protein